MGAINSKKINFYDYVNYFNISCNYLSRIFFSDKRVVDRCIDNKMYEIIKIGKIDFDTVKDIETIMEINDNRICPYFVNIIGTYEDDYDYNVIINKYEYLNFSEFKSTMSDSDKNIFYLQLLILYNCLKKYEMGNYYNITFDNIYIDKGNFKRIIAVDNQIYKYESNFEIKLLIKEDSIKPSSHGLEFIVNSIRKNKTIYDSINSFNISNKQINLSDNYQYYNFNTIFKKPYFKLCNGDQLLHSNLGCITFDNIEYIVSTSASNSIQLIVTINNEKYVLKMFETADYHYNFIFNNLIYELAVYTEKINPLKKYKICPYFLKASGSLEMNIITKQFILKTIHDLYKDKHTDKKVFDNINQKKQFLLKYLNNNIYSDEMNFGYIMTKYINTGTFNELYKKLFIDHTVIINDDIEIIIFQILIACYSMYLSGVAHNDLHSNNIFIKKYDTIKTVHYNINGQWYKFQTNYKVLIFDFDLSYVNNFNNPKINNFLYESSVSNILIEPKDFVKAMNTLYTHHKNIVKDNDSFNKLFTKIYNKMFKNEKDYNNNFYLLYNMYKESKFLEKKEEYNNYNYIIGRNSPKDFEMFDSYENLIKKYGEKYKINNININNISNEKYYYLHKDFFINNTIDVNKIVKTHLHIINHKSNEISNDIQKNYRLK